MAKSKGTRILITLEMECSNLNKRSEGVSRYSTQKNRRNNLNESIKKIRPHCNKPTIHKEIK
jgi:large subunit ribosomal protein L33